ncbi:MAG: glycosyltransferase, partial [Vicinamibacteria bacterium]
NEGVPQALVQAMLVELPCVTTAVGGIPEVAEHERSALVVPPQDAAALAAAIERLLGDAAGAAAMAARAQARFRSTFTVARMVREYEALYAQAVGGGRAR